MDAAPISPTQSPMILDCRRLIALALLVPLSVAPVAAAHAQVSMGGNHGGGGKSDDDDDKTPAAPPAIPGAVSSPDRVAPAGKNAADLDPNAALFDAIDRGDITAAREALGRGADLSAKNVLGQTPIDMSIDLSRNDITFLLLSMRSQNGDEAPAAAGGDEQDASLAAPSGHAELAAPPTIHAVPGGGTPVPSQGFLGFGR